VTPASGLPAAPPGFAASRIELAPSEIVYLFADRFVDSERPQTSNREPVLMGTGKVSAERLAVAAIRAAVVANDACGAARLRWRSGELRSTVDEISAIGPGGRLIGALTQMPFVQAAMAKATPHIEKAASFADPWPAGTLESILLQPRESDALSAIVMDELERSGSSVLGRVKDGLAARGMIARQARAFSWLAPVCLPTESTRRAAQARLPVVTAALAESRTQNLQDWDAMAEAITIALNAGFRG
jgi:hypothetical protein